MELGLARMLPKVSLRTGPKVWGYKMSKDNKTNKTTKSKTKKVGIIVAIAVAVVGLAVLFIPFFRICKPSCPMCAAIECKRWSLWNIITNSKKYQKPTYSDSDNFDWIKDLKAR